MQNIHLALAEKGKGYAVLALALLIFAAVEYRGLLHAENADENIYFYMGKLVSEGKVPYKDFFYAHPPLELLPNALVFRFHGFNIFLLKLIPLLAVIITAVVIFHLAHSAAEGAAASIIFLFSHIILFEATYGSGIPLATLLMLLGLLFANWHRHMLAGVMLGLASLASLLALVPALAMAGIMFFWLKPKHFIAGFLSVFIPVNLFFLAVSGGSYFESVYLFHLAKPVMEGSKVIVFIEVLLQNLFLFVPAALSVLFMTRRVLTPALLGAAYAGFLSLLSTIFPFYFVPLAALLSLPAGRSAASLFRFMPFRKFAFVSISIIFVAYTALSVRELHTIDFAEFKAAGDIADYVKQNSASGDTIFGDSTSVPLIALMSERRIASDLVDTNQVTFKSGVADLQETMGKLRAGMPKFIILRPLYGIGSIPEFREFAEKQCAPAYTVKDPLHADFLVYDCDKPRRQS